MKRHLPFFLLFFLITATASAQQRMPLKKALARIQRVYGTKFSYAEQLTDRVYVQLKEPLSKSQPVEEVLKQILYPNKFLFLYVQDNYYTIVKDTRPAQSKAPEVGPTADPTGTSPATQPEQSDYVQTIEGTVTDGQGKALIGATIKPNRGTQGTTTNSDGQYILRLTQPTQQLTVSFVGMTTQQVPVGNRTRINVVLTDDIQALQEMQVVVSNGYQQIPKERATGAFEQVNAKKLKEVPTVNLIERLEGAVPGVNFNVRSNRIEIRGRNSLNLSDGNQPLIIVDGFPAVNQELSTRTNNTASAGAILSRYNPEDIASITILKDAAAASIWGAQAANGVIVIETKKGRSNSSSINFSTNLSVSQPANLGQLTLMNSAQYIDLERELKTRGFYTDPAKAASWMNFNQNRPLSDALEWMFRVDRGTATAAQRDSALNALSGINNQDQIRRLLLQNAVSQQYTLSLSGGGLNSTYYVSTNYSRDVPVFRSNVGESYFVTANLGNNFLNNRLKLNTTLNYNLSKSQSNQAALNAIGSTNFGLRPYELLEDAQGNRIQRYYQYRQDVVADFTRRGYLPWSYNAVDELNYSNYTSLENRLRFGADLTGTLTDWLQLGVSGIWQRNLNQTSSVDELNSYSMRNRLNQATSVNATTGALVYGLPYGGSMVTRNTQQDSYSLRGQLSINKSWNTLAQLNLVAGSEIRETQERSQAQTRFGYDEDTRLSRAFNPTTPYTTIEGYSSTIGYTDGATTNRRMRFLSYYSNAALSLLSNRYTLSGSLRFDDYSLQGVDRSDRARPLWSAGAKWHLKSERFLTNVNWLDDLQLRLTYGSAGAIPNTTTRNTTINIGGVDNLTNEIYGSISQPGNGQLSWEKTYSTNLGLDFALFNNRLSASVDVYRKRSEDIFWQFPFNATYGWSTLRFNAATMTNHGYELGLKGDVVRTRNVTWSSVFNFSYNTNEVTDSRINQTTTTTLLGGGFTVGMPTDYLMAYRWAGLDKRGQSQIYNAKGEILSDQASNQAITREDLVYAGRTTAPYFGGLFNTLTYKSWTLGVRFTYAIGHVFRRQSIENYPDYQTTTLSGLVGTQQDLALRWRKEGDEATTNVPGLQYISTNSANRYKFSDLLIESASNIRFQQVSLGYTVEQRLLRRLPIKAASLNVSARNLGLIWTKTKSGIDPEYSRTNIYGNLPPVTSFFFSLNASF